MRATWPLYARSSRLPSGTPAPSEWRSIPRRHRKAVLLSQRLHRHRKLRGRENLDKRKREREKEKEECVFECSANPSLEPPRMPSRGRSERAEESHRRKAAWVLRRFPGLSTTQSTTLPRLMRTTVPSLIQSSLCIKIFHRSKKKPYHYYPLLINRCGSPFSFRISSTPSPPGTHTSLLSSSSLPLIPWISSSYSLPWG